MKTSPTQRTLAHLRNEGWGLVQVVERWNPHAQVRQDLFGFIDVLAVHGDIVMGVQATSGTNVSARVAKLTRDPYVAPRVAKWLAPSRKLVIHGWRKLMGRWTVRVLELYRDDQGIPQAVEVA